MLDDISLTVADCEFVRLLGGSGCGKSTLLNLCRAGRRHGGDRQRASRAVDADFQESALLP